MAYNPDDDAGFRAQDDPYGNPYGGGSTQPYYDPTAPPPTSSASNPSRPVLYPTAPTGGYHVPGSPTGSINFSTPQAPLTTPQGAVLHPDPNNPSGPWIPGSAPTGASGNAPSYVNMNDPAQAAVWQAFQQKGITPRDQSDFQYWVDHINSSGGMSDQGNANYWTSRMAQGQGGVGDYLERPEAGSSSGSSASGVGLFDPETLGKIKQAFLSRLGDLSTPVDASNPAVSGAIAANHLTGQRQLQDTRNAIAQQNYRNGTLNTGGYNTEQQQALEAEGAAEAGFAGNAVSQAEQQRQQLLNQLLGLGGSISSNAGNLQLGEDNLGFNYAGLQNSMNRDAILAALGAYGG